MAASSLISRHTWMVTDPRNNSQCLESVLTKLLNGEYYINVHTEIILPVKYADNSVSKRISLHRTDDGSNENPAVTTMAKASVFFNWHKRKRLHKVLFQVCQVPWPVHYKQCACRCNAVSCWPRSFIQEIQLKVSGDRFSLLAALKAGELYITFNSDNSSGEIKENSLMPGWLLIWV